MAKLILNEGIENTKRQSPSVIKRGMNRIISKYCGWQEPKTIRNLWDELYEKYGVSPLFTSGNFNGKSEDGGESWSCTVQSDKPEYEGIDFHFFYGVYKPEQGNKYDFTIYVS